LSTKFEEKIQEENRRFKDYTERNNNHHSFMMEQFDINRQMNEKQFQKVEEDNLKNEKMLYEIIENQNTMYQIDQSTNVEVKQVSNEIRETKTEFNNKLQTISEEIKDVEKDRPLIKTITQITGRLFWKII
jgi:hypothetical protein